MRSSPGKAEAKMIPVSSAKDSGSFQRSGRKEPVLVGELYLDRLYTLPLREPVAREISRFQPVRRDFSLVLDESIAWEKIDQAVAGLRIPELVEWREWLSRRRCSGFRDDVGVGRSCRGLGRRRPFASRPRYSPQ